MALDLLYRLRSLMRRRSQESEVTDELEFHLAQETEKLLRSGLSPDEAARRARLALGFRELVKDECREARGVRWIEELGHDVVFGLRLLRRSPAFASVAIVSLALGIGANTAMFQLLDAVRLRNLPVHAPDRLHRVTIGGDGPSGTFTARYSDLSYAQWEQIQARQQAFSAIAVWTPRRFNLADGGETRPAEGMLVSGAFFETLGLTAAGGRLLDPHDDAPGCNSRAAVISHAFWEREFGGGRDAVGSSLRVDGHAFTIVGITPARFLGVEVGRSYDIAIPLCAEERVSGRDSRLTARRNDYWLTAVGRLRDGWSVERADAQLRVISASVFSASLPTDTMSAGGREQYLKLWLQTKPAGKGFSWLRVAYEKPLLLLLCSAGLVLLIACGNLANLLLARLNARGSEIAVRLALGASRDRLIRQLLTESLMLTLAGAALGLLAAKWVTGALVAFVVTADNPVALDTRFDWRILSYSFAVALVTCVLFGLAPALRAASPLPASARRVAGGREGSMVRRGLAVAQVGLCIVLVAGAMLFGRSAYNLLSIDPGFRPGQVFVTSLDTRRLGFDTVRQKELYRELLERLRSTPGVTAAAQSNIIPMSGWESNEKFTLHNGDSARTRISMVSSGYFQTLGVPLVAGRDFGSQDRDTTETAVIVNEAFVRKFLGSANPIGSAFVSESKKTCRIVGLVKNTKYRDLQEEFRPIVYFPTSQMTFTMNYARYVVRSTLPAADAAKAIHESVASVSRAIDIEFVPFDTHIGQTVVRERLLATLGGGFGALAALLAAVGLYGLLAYLVESRRNEIGIRMALGADRRAVVGLVVREVAWLLGTGAALGLALTLAASRTVSTLLYGLEPNDPLTLGGSVLVLILIGLAAAYVPARRAATLDPLTALRQD